MKDYKITLGLLLLNLFIAFLGIGLVIPVLPTLMNELQISGTVVGYLTAAFAIAQLIVSPLAGKAVDKYGRKIMIVIGLFIFGISEFLFGLGKTIEVLIYLPCFRRDQCGVYHASCNSVYRGYYNNGNTSKSAWLHECGN